MRPFLQSLQSSSRPRRGSKPITRADAPPAAQRKPSQSRLEVPTSGHLTSNASIPSLQRLEERSYPCPASPTCPSSPSSASLSLCLTLYTSTPDSPPAFDPPSPRLPSPSSRAFPSSRYAEVRRLCRSLFGEVGLYDDRLLHRRVAIKKSDRHLVSRGTALSGNPVLEDPLEERHIMQLLSGTAPSHSGLYASQLSDDVRRGEAHVLRALDEWEDSALLYTVMPYCGGGDFFSLVKRQPGMGEATIRRHFRALLHAARYMQALGVAHLDLSLENLLLDDDGQLRVCDYGVARHVAHASPASQRERQRFAGSVSERPGKVAYMAPEVYAGESFDGFAADVWSMGICLFIMLFHVPPYRLPQKSDPRFALIYAGQVERLLQAWELSTAASEGVVDVLKRMLCPDAQRATVEELLQHPWLSETAESDAC